MAFNKNEPQDTTKIRNLSTILTDNFTGIQEGDASFAPWALNLIRRNGAAPSVDPTAIADNIILYSKDSSAGQAELYAINEASGISQITGGAPTATTTGSVFIPGGIIIKWGQFTFSGNTNTQAYATPFPTSGLCTLISPFNNIAATREFYVSTWDANGFTTRTNAAVSNQSYTYISIGI